MRTCVAVLMAYSLLFLASCSKDAETRKDVLIESVRGLENVLDTPLNRGQTLYSRYCSVCHGPKGRGDGFNAYNLRPAPRDFTDSVFLERIDTASITEAIASGGASVGLSPLMPGWGHTLSQRDIELLTRYVIYLSALSDE